jgi:hypothetical protein
MTTMHIINLAAAVLVSGPVASALTQLVKRAAPRGVYRLLVAVAVSILIGAAQAWITGALPHSTSDLTAATLLAAGAAVFAGASAFYRLYFRRKRSHVGRTTARRRRAQP